MDWPFLRSSRSLSQSSSVFVYDIDDSWEISAYFKQIESDFSLLSERKNDIGFLFLCICLLLIQVIVQ